MLASSSAGVAAALDADADRMLMKMYRWLMKLMKRLKRLLHHLRLLVQFHMLREGQWP